MKRTNENSSRVQERTSMNDKAAHRNAQRSGRPNPAQNTINPNHGLNQDEQKRRTNQDEEDEVTNAHEESASVSDNASEKKSSQKKLDREQQTN